VNTPKTHSEFRHRPFLRALTPEQRRRWREMRRARTMKPLYNSQIPAR
jgi:exonuclease I